MSATDRIREAVNGERRVLAPDDLLALCDLADAARSHLARKAVYDSYDERLADALARLDGENAP